MLILPWKLFFFMVLIMGSLIAMSASSWLMAWMGLEINMLALLAILMANKSPRNSEATLKYFLVQALASAILISSAFSASALFSFLSSMKLFSSFILLSLIIKIGGAPFHVWVPQIVEGFSWINNLIVLTWQKLAPFILLANCLETKINSSILNLCIILSSILGAIMGLSQSSIRKILAFSSINHIGWMLSSIPLKMMAWTTYFIFYSALLTLLILMLHSFNIVSLSNSFFSPIKQVQIPFFVTLLSFGGLPPFLGFTPKWIIIQQLAVTSVSIAAILVISSLTALFFYSRLMFSSLLNKSNSLNFSSAPFSKIGPISLFINLSGLALFPVFFVL